MTYITVFADKYEPGWPYEGKGSRTPSQIAPVAAALTHPFTTDAHFVAYVPGDLQAKRLRKKPGVSALEKGRIELLGGVVFVNAIVFDCDDPVAHGTGAPARPDWQQQTHARILQIAADNPGMRWYATRGGFRLLGTIARELRCQDDGERWTVYHDAWRSFLTRVYGIELDDACKDWTRFYRLPFVVRDGVAQQPPVLCDLTSIGAWKEPEDAVRAWSSWQPSGAQPILEQTDRIAAALDDDEQQERLPRIVALIAPCYVLGVRHKVAMGLAGYLTKRGFTPESAKSVIASLPCNDVAGRLRDADAAISAGPGAAGWRLLNEVLAPETCKQLEQLTTPVKPVSPVIAKYQRATRARLKTACKEIKALGLDEQAVTVATDAAYELGRRCPHFIQYEYVLRMLLEHAPASASETIAKRLAAGMREPWNPAEGWREMLGVDDACKLQQTKANAATILVHDERWSGVWGFDRFDQKIRLLKQPPVDLVGPFPRPFDENDLQSIDTWLSQNHGINLQSSSLFEAIGFASRSFAYDSMCDYLDSITWDGVKRIDTWLSRYAGAPDTEYTRTVGRKWLIAAIVRGYATDLAPAKVDTVLVLQSPQGSGKTTLFEILAAPVNGYQNLEGDLRSKDASLALNGRWIIECGELDSLSRTDLTFIKGWLTKRTDRFRPPYERSMKECARRCVFGGSTNATEYLTDETGNRRFWPVSVGAVDKTALQRDRSQLWAEARMAFKRGEQWWLTLNEEVMQTTEAAQRMVRDVWDVKISEYLADKHETTMSLVLTDGLLISPKDQDRSSQMRVAKILKLACWERRQKTENGRKPWYYFRGPGAEPLRVSERYLTLVPSLVVGAIP